MTIPPVRRAWPALLVLVPMAVAAPARGGLPRVPPGFKVRLVAAVPAVTYPCQIATAPDGALFVAEDPMDQVGPYEADDGRILLFREGKEPVVFAEGLRAVFGMAWHEDKLYVMNMPRLTVLRDRDGDGKAEARLDLFKDLGPGPRSLNDHIVSGLQFGMDGRLYISVGDKGVPGVHGLDGRSARLVGGGTMRCRPDGTGIEVVSTGTRNHLEPNLDDRDNLFTYDNTDDGDGWWTRVTHHVDGGYYGYPYDYHARPDRHLPRMAEYGGGSPCGGVVYKEDAWPEEYRGLALWAEWGKRHVAGVRLAPDGASFKVAEYRKFVEAAEGEDFRPIDLALSYDGKILYIADWGMGSWGSKTEKVGRVYAVTYEGKVETRPRGKDSDPIGAQIRALAHPSFNERMRAQSALIGRGKEAIGPASAALADPRTDPVAARHLVWTLDGLECSPSVEVGALASRSADVRAQAARALGLRGGAAASGPVSVAARDADPTVRLQAIIALGRLRDASGVGAILPSLGDPDPFLAYSARVALRRIGDWKAATPGLASADPRVRAGLLGALEEQYDGKALGLLLLAMTDETKPAEERARALFTLSQAHRKTPPWDGKWWGTRPTQGKPPAKSVDWPGTLLVLTSIRTALDDPDAPVRRAAVVAVRETKDRDALPKLRARFSAEADADVRREIARTFGALDDRAALPLLIAAVRDPKAAEALREAALSSVETIGTDAAVSALVDLLRESDLKPDRRARVIGSLGRFKARSAVRPIAGQLADPDPHVRVAAAEALGKIGDTTATPPIRPLLKDGPAEVRNAAIGALGLLRDRESIPGLIAAADDEATRFEATLALARMPDVRALQVHLRGLADRSPDLRKASSTAINAVRDQAGPVLQRLADRKELPPAALPELRKIYASIRPIAAWHLVGPIAGKSARPPFRTNAAVDLKTPIVEGGRPLAWRPFSAESPDGAVDLAALYPGPNSNKSAFALAEIRADSARPARLAVGSDDTLHVWLNGKEVYKFDESRGYSPEQDTVDVALNKGTNRLIVRCGNGSGPWAFSVGVSASGDDLAFLRGPAAGGFDPDKFRAVAVQGKGRADRGRSLFLDLKGVACVKCHAVSGQGGLVGPELSGVGLKYPREELIRSVLYPSQRISSGYEPVILAMEDGRVLTGIVKGETPEAIEIEDAEARRIRVPKGEVEARKPSDVSLMPNGLAEGLSPADFADLIAYLESLKDAASLQGHAPGPKAAVGR